MYPGPSGSAENHKKGYCSDGVKQNMEQSSQNEDPPRDNKPTSCTPAQWPQPHGIFTHGTHFNAFAFLTKIREMYEKVVIEDDSGELLIVASSEIHQRRGSSPRLALRLLQVHIWLRRNSGSGTSLKSSTRFA
jgi:hypothetical protein